ncbi:MAG TPA: CDP-alcohol phosphatidyltransferase family protein [Fusobacterium sp.]|uniref:CDP-alcohol phosphatidyltransferase family protein n=1 Tax=Fusobacterium sp. TaxID=68766 RepID=UPI002F3FA9CE
MISIYQLKPKFQSLLRPLTRVLFQLGITANMVTLFAMFASIALGIFLYVSSTVKIYYLSLPFFLFFRMALNAIDGMLAREFHQKSHLGGIYNEIGDIISDSFLFFAFFPLGFSPLLLFSVVILAAISEVIGILGAVEGTERRYDGPMGKSDRAFVLSCIGILYALQILSILSLQYIFIFMLLLLLYTCYNRIQAILKSGGKK